MTQGPTMTAMAITLLGGVGLFLVGMTMLTDGLKLAAGRALERILAAWTRTRLHGLITGIFLTALLQSSTAMTVAAIGFVNAGLLTFTSALWVVFGSNLGSSLTGWLVALVGFKMKIDAFALPFIGLGMALKLTGEGSRRSGLGMALAGFGLMFLGIDILKNGFAGTTTALPALGNDLSGLAMAVGVGVLLTIVLQASSATLTLVLTGVASGMMPLQVGAAMVIGANVGTTLTGILAAMGATANARRLAAAHVLFNVVTAVVALATLSPLLWLIHAVDVWILGSGDAVTQLVLFHTGFNLLGVLLMWPLSGFLVRWLLARFGQADAADAGRPRYLDHNVAAVPALALQALRRELARLGHLAADLASDAARLNPQALPWEPAPPQAEAQLARQLETVAQLQRAIGQFVSELSRHPMHEEVAQQLPELLRIATHFDTLSRVMHHVGVQGSQTPRPVTAPPKPLLVLPDALQHIWPPTHSIDGSGAGLGDASSIGLVACVAPVFTAALAFFAMADPQREHRPQAGPWLASEARDAFEDCYQTAKAALLREGASGTVEVNAVYDWLARLSDLRRAVEQGFKAAQRLAALPDLPPLPAAEGNIPAAEAPAQASPEHQSR